MLLVFTSKRGSVYCGAQTVELFEALHTLGIVCQEVENLTPFPVSEELLVEAVSAACLHDLDWKEFPWLYDTETRKTGRTLHDLEMAICTSTVSNSSEDDAEGERSNALRRDQGSTEADPEVH